MRLISASAIATLLATAASAATLTFDGNICNGGNACTNGAPIDQTYGDMAGVDVIYDADLGSIGDQSVAFWDTGYSNLTNVVYGTGSGASITFAALAGMTVNLQSFSLGAWITDRTIEWSVVDTGTLAVLASSGPIVVSAGTSTDVDLGSWSSVAGLEVSWATDAYYTAIDNLVYSSGPVATVPLPAAGLLLLVGLGGIAAMRRRMG